MHVLYIPIFTRQYRYICTFFSLSLPVSRCLSPSLQSPIVSIVYSLYSLDRYSGNAKIYPRRNTHSKGWRTGGLERIANGHHRRYTTIHTLIYIYVEHHNSTCGYAVL